VISFASAKGGAGKTVITATIGTFLKAIGKRVLLIDTDAATNGLTLLYIREVMSKQEQLSHEGRPTYGLFEDADLGSDATEFQLPSGIDLIPATYHFVNTEEYPAERFEKRLLLTLKPRRDQYDYILVDAQAGADFYASVAMRRNVSDLVVLVAEYDPMSAAGLERLKGLFRDDLTYARTWILLNKILPEFAKNFSDFLEIARYLSPIPWDADVVRAYARRRLALDTENGNAFTLAVLQTIRSLLGDEIDAELDRWMKTRVEAIRRPIEDRYTDLERELAEVMRLSAPRKSRLAIIFKDVWEHSPMIPIFVAMLSFAVIANKMSDKILLSWWPALLIGALLSGVGSAVIVTLAFKYHARGNSADAGLELAKLERRRKALEIELQKLESLRAATPEVLIRKRGDARE
jgi:cellulose biosynthesis protein BcsQ